MYQVTIHRSIIILESQIICITLIRSWFFEITLSSFNQPNHRTYLFLNRNMKYLLVHSFIRDRYHSIAGVLHIIDQVTFYISYQTLQTKTYFNQFWQGSVQCTVSQCSILRPALLLLYPKSFARALETGQSVKSADWLYMSSSADSDLFLEINMFGKAIQINELRSVVTQKNLMTNQLKTWYNNFSR